MDNLQGSGPISPQDRKLYEQEYRQGLDLFQRALNQYVSAQEVHKKEAFREVMDRAMQVMNETARGLKRQDLLQQNSKIETDYENFQASQDPSAKNQLLNDLNQAHKTIG